MNNVQMLTNAVSNFYTTIGKAQQFSDAYLSTDLLEVNFYSLYQTLRRESQQVYHYYYATENPDLLDYRSPKMFPCGALLLYRSEDYFMESEGIATGHYLELWLLENLTLAVTACFTITHNMGTRPANTGSSRAANGLTPKAGLTLVFSLIISGNCLPMY